MPFKSDKQRKGFYAQLEKLDLNANRLPVQFSIIVPSTIFDKKIKAHEFSKRIDAEKKYFDRKFNGDTAVKDVGSYVTRKYKKGKRLKDKIIKEKGVIVESSTTPEVYNKNRHFLASHIKKRQKDWKQSTILYKIQSESFIYPKQSYLPSSDKKGKIIVD